VHPRVEPSNNLKPRTNRLPAFSQQVTKPIAPALPGGGTSMGRSARKPFYFSKHIRFCVAISFETTQRQPRLVTSLKNCPAESSRRSQIGCDPVGVWMVFGHSRIMVAVRLDRQG
jgi:hypothetical protein